MLGGALIGFADSYLADVDRRALRAGSAHAGLRARPAAVGRAISTSRRSGRPGEQDERRCRRDRDAGARRVSRTFLSAVFRILFFSAALVYLEWSLATIALVMAPLFWLAARSFSRLIKGAAREKRRRSGSLGRRHRGEPRQRPAGAGLQPAGRGGGPVPPGGGGDDAGRAGLHPDPRALHAPDGHAGAGGRAAGDRPRDLGGRPRAACRSVGCWSSWPISRSCSVRSATSARCRTRCSPPPRVPSG